MADLGCRRPGEKDTGGNKQTTAEPEKNVKNRMIAAITMIAALPMAALAAGSAGTVASSSLLAGPVLLAVLGAACCYTGRRQST